jgi:hypothetical protein
VQVSLPKELLEKQVSEAVPWTLAKASGRSAGAAGKVTYEVKRDPLRVVVRDGELLVATRLVADIDVCKPIGPVCLHYGKCRPEWQATATVPATLSLDAAPRPRLSVAITRGCVLSPVGYDATPELERITSDQAKNARGQITRQVAAAHGSLLDAVEQARRGLRSGQDCVQIEPVSVAQTPLVERDGQLEFAFALGARLQLDCAPHRPKQPYEGGADPLPATEIVPQLDGHTRLVVARDLSFEALAESLTRDGTSVRLVSGIVDGKTRLVAGVSGLGQCDPEWVFVEPRIERNQLLVEPVGVDGANSAAARWLQEHGAVDLPEQLVRLRAHLQEFDDRLAGDLTRELRNGPLRVEGPLDLHPLTVPGPSHLRVGFELSGKLRVGASEASE